MKSERLAVLIAAAMLCSCATKILLNPDWKRDAGAEKTCALVLYPEKIRLSYLGANERLKADSVLIIKQNIMRCMKRQMRRNGYFSDVWFDDFAAGVRCTSMVIQAGFSATMPYPDVPVAMVKRQPDYLLILDTVTIRSRIEKSSARQSMRRVDPASGETMDVPLPYGRTVAGFLPLLYLGTVPFGQIPGGMFYLPVNPGQYFKTKSTWYGKGTTVLLRCAFVLWDVKQRCAVRRGVVRVHGNEGFTIDDWSNFIDDAQKDMFAEMSFFKITADYSKVIGHQDTLHVTGLQNRISPAEKKAGWVVTNTIVTLGSDARENVAGERVGGPLQDRRPGIDTLSFVAAVSGGEFSAPFCTLLGERYSKLLPAMQPCRAQLQRCLMDQLRENFKDDNKPLDTLGDSAMAAARADSLDYLVVLYPLYNYPDTGDKIEKIADYDVRMFASLYDVGSNVSLMDFHIDLDNSLDHADVKKFREAVRIFGYFAQYHLAAFLRL